MAVAGAIAIFIGTSGLFLAIVAGIALAIEVAGLLSNMFNTFRAMDNSKDSPTKAHKYEKADTLVDTLKVEGFNKEAKFVSVLEIGSGLILAGSALLSGIKGLLSKSKAISNFFGGKKHGLGKLFIVKIDKKSKVKIWSGLKSIFTDKKYMSKLAKTFKKDFKKDTRKFIRFMKGKKNTFNQLGIWKTGKKILINTKNQIISKYEEINDFKGTSKVFNFKLSKNTTEALKVLNKGKLVTDTIKDIKDLKDFKEFKFKYKFAENITYEDIYDVIRGIMKINEELKPEVVN